MTIRGLRKDIARLKTELKKKVKKLKKLEIELR